MRLGLIGGTDSKRTSGVYQPEDVVSLQDAKKYISRFGYDGVFNALASSGNEEGFDVSRDGRYVYVAVRGTRTTATIFQYECSTPWDLSTITYSSKSLVIGDYDTNCNGIAISDDGTRLFFMGYGVDTIWSCTLATPYDLATATVDVKKVYVGTQDATPQNPFFGDSGTKMYVMGATNDTVYQYTLSTAWDVSTATYASKSFSVTTQETTPFGLFLGDSGTKMYIVGQTNDTVYQYTLSTAWDVSTASYASKSKAIGTEETNPRALFFKPDGLKMYVIGTTGDDVNEYDLSTAWDVSTATFLRVSAGVGEVTPTGLWFKDDGTKMYVTGSTNDTVREFTLSTAWNVSTISFVRSLSIGFETTPTGVTFKDDGTKLYVSGQTNDCVYEILLGTAWDISTAKGFIYVFATESAPRGLHINNDGTLLFLGGSATGIIRKYTLSTAYELGTATLSQSSSAFTGLFGVHVSADGLRIYVTLDSNAVTPAGGRQVRQITLTSPNDLSTASMSSVELIPIYGLTGNSTSPWGVRASPDGTRMFVLSDTISGLYQFSLRFA
jgi:6-phosphogluconolactonase (cycloisomerase 2 family)